MKVAPPPCPGFELEHAEVPAFESVRQARVARPEHPRHRIQEDAGGQVHVLQIPGGGELSVHEGRLQTALPRREQVESKTVRRVHARCPVAHDDAPVVGVFPLERHVGRRVGPRRLPEAVCDVRRICDRGPEFEPAGTCRAQEHEGPRRARRPTTHAADSGAAPTAARSARRRFTSSGNRRGRPRSSAHTSQVRARASVASSFARAIR